MKDKISVLIVENEFLIAYSFKRELERMGYEVHGLVSSGIAAIEVAGKMKPDIVLMDMRLDGTVSGLEAAREITSRYAIPIIFVTSQTDQKTLEQMNALHPAACLSKPIMGRQIHAAIMRHFRTI